MISLKIFLMKKIFKGVRILLFFLKNDNCSYEIPCKVTQLNIQIYIINKAGLHFKVFSFQ